MVDNPVGKKCCMAACPEFDILSYECDRCNKTFCQDHFKYELHKCPKTHASDRQSIVCPQCSKCLSTIKGVVTPEVANRIIDRHLSLPGECKPTLTEKCPLKGCRQKLTTIQKFDCSKCKITVCINHRLPESHHCDYVKKNKCLPPDALRSGFSPERVSPDRLNNFSYENNYTDKNIRKNHLVAEPKKKGCGTWLSALWPF